MASLKNKAIFLDRDGTINVEKNYLYNIDDFEFIDGVPEAIKLFNEYGYKVIVITNQSGVARGIYNEDDIIILHNFIDNCLKDIGAHIDYFYYCPHHPQGTIDYYRIECNCRKPKDGMIRQAIDDYNISIEGSWIIGDKISDIRSGEDLGIPGILVSTGHGNYEKDNYNSIVLSNLLDAAMYITKRAL